MTTGTTSEIFTVGARVYLRGCPHGEPGRVLRIERTRVAVLWPDLDYIGRHVPESLVLVEAKP
jgi:hypothetical protein